MLLEKIINHINDYMIISNITLYIMSISILMMSLLFIYNLFFKKEHFERNMLSIGVVVRVLMFIGLTIEFAHQMTTYNKFNSMYYTAKWNAVIQLIHFLFWGYIAVMGVYYVFTMEVKKFRGLMYTFDISMMSIPVVYGVILIIFHGVPASQWIQEVLLIILPTAILYLFFQSYWRKKILWYAAFFIVAIISIICAYKLKSLKLLLPFSVFAALLEAYDLFLADRKIVKYKKALLIFPLSFIFIANPFYNIWTLVETGQDYYVTNIFNNEVRNIPLKEIEQKMRIATGDTKDKLLVKSVSNDYVGKSYELALGNYNIRVGDDIGKYFIIEREGKSLNGKANNNYNKPELLNKTLKVLKDMGFSINLGNITIAESVENGENVIKFYNQYADGNVVDKMLTVSEVRWDSNGELDYLAVTGIFDIKDYPNIKINRADIDGKIKEIYKMLNEKVPDYVYNNKRTIWRTFVDINCENGDSFEIDGTSGEILSYDSKAEMIFDKSAEGVIKNKEKAINFAKNLSSFWEVANLKETQLGKSYAHGQYNFVGSLPAGKVTIETLVNSKGKLVHYGENITPNGKKYSGKSFKISKNEAINLVGKKYSIFQIYSTSASLVLTTDDYHNNILKWRVCVIPFMSPEKQYYLVDTNAAKVEAVSDYSMD